MFSSIIAKKKLILLIFIVLGISAMLILIVLSQKAVGTVSGDMFEGTSKNLLDNDPDKKVQAQEHIEARLQETINSLEEVDTSIVTITPSNKDAALKASVIIKLSQGETLTPEKQANIKKIIQGSIREILEENIALSIS